MNKMGSSQSQESPTATVTRSQDQASGRVGDLSSRKSASSVPSRQSQLDPRKRIYLSIGDGPRGEGRDNTGSGGLAGTSRYSQEEVRSSDDSPPSREHTHSGSSGHSSHSHGHHRSRAHHRHRQRPSPDDSPSLGGLELSIPMFSSSRTQPTRPSESTNDPLDDDLDFVLVPRPPPPRHRRYPQDSRSQDMELDFSVATLSQRLREAGLFTDGSVSAASAGSRNSGSSSRRQHRQRRHHSSNSSSRSRPHLSSSAPPSSVVLVRGLSASKLTVHVLSLLLFSHLTYCCWLDYVLLSPVLDDAI